MANEEIDLFVRKMIEGDQSDSYYAEQRRSIPEKVAEDIAIGKKAEYLAAIYLHETYGFPLIRPDVGVYSAQDKSWSEDLVYGHIDAKLPNIHVKSCSRKTYEYCRDCSWTFQYGNNGQPGGMDAVLVHPNGSLVVLMFVETSASKSGIVKAIVPDSVIGKYMKDPLNKRLKGIKKCIYFMDLLADKCEIENPT